MALKILFCVMFEFYVFTNKTNSNVDFFFGYAKRSILFHQFQRLRSLNFASFTPPQSSLFNWLVIENILYFKQINETFTQNTCIIYFCIYFMHSMNMWNLLIIFISLGVYPQIKKCSSINKNLNKKIHLQCIQIKISVR